MATIDPSRDPRICRHILHGTKLETSRMLLQEILRIPGSSIVRDSREKVQQMLKRRVNPNLFSQQHLLRFFSWGPVLDFHRSSCYSKRRRHALVGRAAVTRLRDRRFWHLRPRDIGIVSYHPIRDCDPQRGVGSPQDTRPHRNLPELCMDAVNSRRNSYSWGLRRIERRSGNFDNQKEKTWPLARILKMKF